MIMPGHCDAYHIWLLIPFFALFSSWRLHRADYSDAETRQLPYGVIFQANDRESGLPGRAGRHDPGGIRGRRPPQA